MLRLALMAGLPQPLGGTQSTQHGRTAAGPPTDEVSMHQIQTVQIGHGARNLPGSGQDGPEARLLPR